MRNLLAMSLLFLCSIDVGRCQKMNDQYEKVILENGKLKVIEYFSNPRGDVCGLGMHYHAPHLTVALTDAKVQLIMENGESQEVEVPSGASFWSEAETHSVINSGTKPTKFILVFLKK